MSSPLLERRLVPWRCAVGLALALAIGGPLGFLLVETLGASPLLTQSDLVRLAVHYGNTLALCGGTLLLALPMGTLLAVFVYRTDLPGRLLFRALIFAGLFVPLPIVLSAWQGFWGADGWWPLSWWENAPGRPWTAGLVPAIWVHAVAGLPWVAFLMGLAVERVERSLEEEALLAGPPWRVLWRVTLPRCRGMLLAAALLLIVQVAGEITVTDMFQVPTLAEDIYLQFTLGDRQALARAVWHALPWAALLGAIVIAVVRRLHRALPGLDDAAPTALVFPLGRWRWLAAGLVLLAAVFLAGLPASSLIYRMGRLTPGGWSAAAAWHRYALQWHVSGKTVAIMLMQAAAVGLFTALLAIVSAWLLRGAARWFVVLLIGLALLAGLLPGTALGIGLIEMIRKLSGWSGTFESAFYNPGGPLATIWVQCLRFWPLALAMMWPVVTALPRELVESYRLEGHGPFAELRNIILPSCRRPLLLTAALVMSLSLAEVSASYRVESPGWETFARLLFDRLHFGVDADVASLALVMLTGVVGLVIVGGLTYWLVSVRE